MTRRHLIDANTCGGRSGRNSGDQPGWMPPPLSCYRATPKEEKATSPNRSAPPSHLAEARRPFLVPAPSFLRGNPSRGDRPPCPSSLSTIRLSTTAIAPADPLPWIFCNGARQCHRRSICFRRRCLLTAIIACGIRVQFRVLPFGADFVGLRWRVPVMTSLWIAMGHRRELVPCHHTCERAPGTIAREHGPCRIMIGPVSVHQG